jgi:hypothetical protein
VVILAEVDREGRCSGGLTLSNRSDFQVYFEVIDGEYDEIGLKHEGVIVKWHVEILPIKVDFPLRHKILYRTERVRKGE